MGAVDDGVGCGQLPLAVLLVARPAALAEPGHEPGALPRFHGSLLEEGTCRAVRSRVRNFAVVVVLLDSDTGLLEVGSDLVVERDELDELIAQATVVLDVPRECDARKGLRLLVDTTEGVYRSTVGLQGFLAVVVERLHSCESVGSHGCRVEGLRGHHDLLSEGFRPCIDARRGVALMKEATQ